MKCSKNNCSRDPNITKAYWFNFFRGLHFFSAVLVPFFTLWGKISFGEIMIVQAVFTFSSFLLEIPTGVIADKFGRKASLILAGIFGILAPLIYVSSPNLWVFMLAEFVWAIGFTLKSGADSALIYDSLKEQSREKESKKVLARYSSFGLAGILVAAPIGSLIAEFFGITAPMFFTSFAMVVSLLISFTFKEPKINTDKEKKGYWKMLSEGVHYLKNHKDLKVLLFNHIFIGALPFFIIWVYQVILQDYGVSVGFFGIVHALMVVGEVLVLNNLKGLEKFCSGKKNYLLYSALILGLLFIGMAFIKNLYFALFAILFIGSFGLTRKDIFTNYFNKFIESHNRATVLSVVSMIYSLSQALIYIFLGKLIDHNLVLGLVIVGLGILLVSLFSKIEENHLID